MVSSILTTKPQFPQVVGWASPRGAPQATQLDSPSGLAAPQNSQQTRVSFSDKAYEAPNVITARSITFQTLSLSWIFSISCARSSNRPRRLNGFRSAEKAV